MSDHTDLTIEQRFRAFHEANPHVYETLRDLALQAVERGRERIGIKMLFEAARWQRFLVTDDPTGFKLNNVFTAHYARLLMEREPALAGVFETRQLRSERVQFDVVSDFDRRQRLAGEVARQDALERVAPAPIVPPAEPADPEQLFAPPSAPPSSAIHGEAA